MLSEQLKIVVRIGAISWDRACNILGEMPSGPGAFDVSRLSRSFLIPDCSILMSGIGGALISGRVHLEVIYESA